MFFFIGTIMALVQGQYEISMIVIVHVCQCVCEHENGFTVSDYAVRMKIWTYKFILHDLLL